MPAPKASTSDVRICELSPRYGLQFLGHLESGSCNRIPLDKKLRLVRILQDSNVSYIETGSFVSDSIPQMSDTDALARNLKRHGGQQLGALVANRKKFLSSFPTDNLDTLAVFVSASEPHSVRNVGVGINAAVAMAEEVANEARSAELRLRGYISCAFQDFIEDHEQPSDLNRVKALVAALLSWGCESVSLSDTGGMTNPYRVAEVLDSIAKVQGVRLDDNISVHFHDGAGFALANAYQAYVSGARSFDASLGGLGGNPKAWNHTGFTGSVATEQLVSMFKRMGIRTGVSLSHLRQAGAVIYEITKELGEYQPPSPLLRQWMGCGERWEPISDYPARANLAPNDS